MKKAKIITMISTVVLIAGLVTAFVTSKKYTREIYFKTPEEAINYFIDNYEYRNIDKVKDALTARTYYQKTFNNHDFFNIQELKTQSYTLKKMNNEEKNEEINYIGEYRMDRLKDKDFEIYYIADNEDKYIDTKFLMVKDGDGWTLDKYIERGIYN